jgi:iron(III) transport system ATP-binding protein
MIELREVKKAFGDVIAVEGLSLIAAKGSSTIIHGPSGSGKTTLLRLIAGLEMPDEGEIFIAGSPASRPGWVLAPHERNLGFLFQSPALWPHMTVAQNILFGLKNLPREAANERLDEVLRETSLQSLKPRYPSQLSGGEARRVSLARTLAPRPEYLLMDEPLVHLDHDLKADMIHWIKRTVIENEATMIYVTHDFDEAGQISQGSPLEMRDGRLLDPQPPGGSTSR